MAAAVIDVLRRFLPAFLRGKPALGEAQRRAVWAITHCRTPVMGGHLHACKGGVREFHFHSCNHRACPQCGKAATAQWVERELTKRVGAPYFMVTFTLPEELRCLFFTLLAKEIYLRHVLPRGMRAIRHYGYCHPAAKVKRERVAVHTGRPLLIGAFELQPPMPASARKCPCCGAPMLRIMTIPAPWQSTRAPPPKKRHVA